MTRFLFVLLMMLLTGAAHAEQKPPLFEAARIGDPHQTTQLLSQGQDVNQKDKHKNTPLHYVADPGWTVSRTSIYDRRYHPRSALKPNQDYPAVAKLLIDKGADLNAKNKFGETPLFLATATHPEIASILVAHGASTREKQHIIIIGSGLYMSLAVLVFGSFYWSSQNKGWQANTTISRPNAIRSFIVAIIAFVLMLEINLRLDFWTRTVTFALFDLRPGRLSGWTGEYSTFRECAQKGADLQVRSGIQRHCFRQITTGGWLGLNLLLSFLVGAGIASYIQGSLHRKILVVNKFAIFGLSVHFVFQLFDGATFLSRYWDPFGDKFRIEAIGTLWLQVIVASNAFAISTIAVLAALNRRRMAKEDS